MSIDRVKRGDPLAIRADDWNRIADLLERTTGTQPGSGTGIAQIVSIQDDYITCAYYDEQDDSAVGELFVARPWMLSRAPFDGAAIAYENGQTITYTYVSGRERSADDGSATETQVMTPDYYVGEILDVFPKRTGVALPDGTFATWQDMNTCGRFWALEA